MIALKRFIERYTSLTNADWDIIQSAFVRKEFARNELLLAEGNICKYFYFLEKGLIRYYIIKDGDEITKFFTSAPYCFTSKESFTNQKPSSENIEILEDTVVWQTTRAKANELLILKSWDIFTRKFMHEVQIQIEELLMENKMETAETRYLKLKDQYPDILPKIPLKHLSSFLGIAPQSLSRIRKKYNS